MKGIIVLSVLALASLVSSYPKMREKLDLLPIEDLRALLDQGEKVLETLSAEKKESEGKRKPRDFVPTSSRNANKQSQADTFKPSASAKSSEDSFKPVKPIKSEKIIVQNAIVPRPKQTPPPTKTELIPESTTTRPSTSPPTPSSTSSPPPPTTPPAELLATADPTLLGALGDASPEILAALQEAAPENLKVFLTFAQSSTPEKDPSLI